LRERKREYRDGPGGTTTERREQQQEEEGRVYE